MRQGVVLPETPRDRREREGLEEDLRAIASSERPIRIRPRHFRPSADAYLAASRGPLAYMLRLHEIEKRTADLEEECRAAWRELAEDCGRDAARFSRLWRKAARRLSFGEINDLIERHNLWYPVESNLPMDPRTGDYVLVNGRDYRLVPLGAEWVLERFPPDLERAAAAREP